MAKIINIDIDPEGNLTVDLEGFHGKGCADVAKVFKAIGQVTTEHKKPEFHHKEERLQQK